MQAPGISQGPSQLLIFHILKKALGNAHSTNHTLCVSVLLFAIRIMINPHVCVWINHNSSHQVVIFLLQDTFMVIRT